MNQDDLIAKEKIHQETSKIEWSALQRFFASGLAVYVAPDVDLVTAADAFSQDNKAQVSEWMASKQVHLVSDQQASQWIEKEAILWAVVVKPWVLVQPI